MSAPERDKAKDHLLPDNPPEYREGVWLDMEGGEEDYTIGPSKLPRYDYERARLRSGQALATAASQDVRSPGAANVTPARSRSAYIDRATAETQIEVGLSLDGTGQADVQTHIGFFDHMLTLLAKQSLCDLLVKAKGDLHVDAHHTVEDVGICFGQALAQALGDKAGIRRYGSATLPMDETLVTAAVDLSGRPFCVWNVALPPEMLGAFNAPLAEEFWRAVASRGAFNLHVLCQYGRNAHHIVEAVFKATARALRQAVELDPRVSGIPSTKGLL
jgi:imidazoleglycerol-phosphate dehydratase